MSFKETSLGTIPENWDVVNLEEQLESLIDYRGKTPKKSETGIVTLSAKSVKMGEIDYSKAYYVSPETYKKFMVRGFPQKGDVLLTTEAPLGCVAKLDRSDVCVAQRLITLRGKKNLLHNDYLRFYLSSTIGQQQLHSRATGSTVQGIKRSEFSKVELILPDYDSQKVIVQHISALEDKIALNTQINQTLEAMAQALFKSWFVDFDPVKAKMEARSSGGSDDAVRRAAMAVISGKSDEELVQFEQENPEAFGQLAATADLFPEALVESELGLIPEGWGVKPLDVIANYQNGLALQKFRPEENEVGLPVLKIAQLSKGFADGVERATSKIKPECIVNNGDIVFSWSGSLMVDIWCGGTVALNQHLFKVTSDLYPKWYYLCYTKHHLKEFQRIASAKAVTMGHIKREHLSQALCAVPTDKLLAVGDNSIGSIIEMQIVNRLESSDIAITRDTLLPKLLSGEIDLSSFDDREVGE